MANPQFTPDASAIRLCSDLAAKLIGFHSSKCVCSHWTWMRRSSGPPQLWRSGALQSKYAGLLLPDAGGKPHEFSTKQAAQNWK